VLLILSRAKPQGGRAFHDSGSIALGGIGTTVAMHRMLSNKTLKTNRIVEHLDLLGRLKWVGTQKGGWYHA